MIKLMDCLIGIGTSIAGKVVESTFSLVGSQLGYCFYYKTYTENLKNKVRDLKGAKERIQHQVDEATRNLEEIEADVQNWLCEVSNTIEDGEEFILEREQQLANVRCHNRFCPNLLSRYKLSKEANRTIQRIVDQLTAAGRFNTVSHTTVTQQIDFEDKGYKLFETRKKILIRIMEALRDPKIRFIGVHGMAGVGKTMLAKDVANQARKLFNVVIMVTVSQDPNWNNIQHEIGENLDLKKLKETTGKLARADLLKRRLKEEKEVLLILDDLWQEVDLQDVGICFGDDEEKCKILFTSRSQEVLRDDMSIEHNFHIEVLSDDEGNDLFNKIVGDLREKSDFQTLATQIVKECAGLPLAIATVASALKNKGLYDWRNALTELKRSTFVNIDGMEEKVYKSIKLSYDFLRSEEAKSLFLLCSMREEDANIHLYWLLIEAMGWDLFQNVYTLEETICRLHALVNKLKAHYLLLEGDHYWSVKMHDVVRDVGISIASKERCMYNIGSDKELEQYLQKKKLEGSTAISLQYYGVHALPEMLNCKQLELLLMPKAKSSTVPDRLFEVTENLGHLDLSWSYLKPIPSSFKSLQNLKSLILNGCKVVDVAIIGELKCLQALSFRKSEIVSLPEQIGQLTRLRLLDLNSCSRLKVIYPNVISKLTRLEELNMLGTFINWEDEGFSGERENARLTELKNLVQLSAIHLHIPPDHNCPKSLFKDKLERFVILIEDHKCRWLDDHKLKTDTIFCTRSLKLGVESVDIVEELGLGALLKRSEELHLDGLKGLNNVIPQLDSEGFPQLKHLVFKNNFRIKCIIDMMYQCISPCNVFQCLESLTLEYMLNLETICHGKLELESFGKLRVLSIIDCNQLRDVFSASVAKLLLQLEKMEVKECWKMKDIVTHDGESIYNERILPKIQSLRLEVLPNLQRFYELISSVETIPTFFNGELRASSSCFQHLRELVIVRCHSLKYLYLSSAPLTLVQLNTLEIRDCCMMEEIIKTNHDTDKVLFLHLTSLRLENLPKLIFIFNDNVTFPSLQRMEIREMDKLEKIWQTPSASDSCCKLEEIEVFSCKSLRKMLSSSLLRRLENIRKLRIKKCEMLEEVFEMNQNSNVEATSTVTPLSHLYLEELPNLKHVWLWSTEPHGAVTFENLKTISTKSCPSLKNLFPASVTKCLHQLEDISVKDCGIEEIVGKEEELEKMGPELFVFPKLTKMHLEQLPEFMSFYRGPYTFKSPSLKSLEVIECAKANKVFGWEFSSVLEISTEDQYLDIPIQQDALFSLDKVLSFPKLEHLYLSSSGFERIWDEQFPGGSTCFQNLTKLLVDKCGFLRHLFSATVALNLVQLNQLEIKGCNMVEEVIINTDEYRNNISYFPKLTLLKLEQLPKLTRFSTGTFVDFPSLTEIIINGCRELKSFIANSKTTNILIDSEELKEVITPNTTTLSLFDEHVAIPNLKKIELRDMDCLELIWHELIDPNSFSKLKVVIVNNCANLVKLFPSNVLGRLPSLTYLAIRSWDLLEEVALLLEQSVGPVDEEELKLSDDHQRRSFQLKFLTLLRCDRFKRLGPHSMSSFQNVRILAVVKCHGVINLFTPRTAKSLTQLKLMHVARCKQMTEIIGGDDLQGKTDEAREICFNRLEFLQLDRLPSLTMFCSGNNYSIRFPNLKHAWVMNCPEMMSFSGQVASTPKLKRLHIMNDPGVGDTSSGDEKYEDKLEDHETISESSDSDTESEIDEDLDDTWWSMKLRGGDLNATIREFRTRPEQYPDIESLCVLS